MAASQAASRYFLVVRTGHDVDPGRGGSKRRWRIVHIDLPTYDGQVRAAHNELRMTPGQRSRPEFEQNRIRIRPIEPRLPRPLGQIYVMAMESLASHGQLEIEAISTVERTDALHTPSLDHGRCATLPCRTAATSGRGAHLLQVDGIAERWMPRTRDPPGGCRGARVPGCVPSAMPRAPACTAARTPGPSACVRQDFAHITVGALRSLGLPARYVSGYPCR